MTKSQILGKLNRLILDSHKTDRLSLAIIESHIKKGRYSQAYQAYKKLDTFVREGMPESVILYIRKKDPKNCSIKFKFSLVDKKGKEVDWTNAEYHVTQEEAGRSDFAASVYFQAEDWQKKTLKLVIKQIK